MLPIPQDGEPGDRPYIPCATTRENGVSDIIFHVFGRFHSHFAFASFTADSDDLHYTLLTRRLLCLFLRIPRCFGGCFELTVMFCFCSFIYLYVQYRHIRMTYHYTLNIENL